MEQDALEKPLADALDRLEKARKDKDPDRITRERLAAEKIANDLEAALDRAEQARLAYWRAAFAKSVDRLEAEIQPLLNEVACYWRLSVRSMPFAQSGVLNGLAQRIDDNLPDLDRHAVPVAPIASRGLYRADREI